MDAAPPGHILFLGPFDALEEEFLRRVAQLKKDDPLRPVDVLAGSNLLGVYLRRLVATRVGAVANLRLLTFLDLARQLVPEPDPRPALPALGAALLARRALLRTPGARVFGELRDRPSLAAALVRTADDLRDAGIPETDFARLVPRAGQTGDRREFLAGVAETLAAFESYRQAFSDPTSLLERASRAGAYVTPEPLLVYGLYDLGGVREALLSACSAGRPVVAFVPEGEPGRRTDRAIGPPLRRELFEPLLRVQAVSLPSPGPPPEVVSVVSPSDNVEARETVRELLRGVADGIPLHAMAVLLRDPGRQEPPLVAELRQRQIPFYRPAGAGNSRSPAGRVARALVALAARDVARKDLEALFALLEGLGALPPGPSGPIRAADLRTALDALAFSEGREALDRKLDAARRRLLAPLDAADDPDGRIASRRRRARESLDELSRAFSFVGPAIPSSRPAGWAEWAGRLSTSFDLVLKGHPARKSLDVAVDAVAALEEAEPSASTSAEDLLSVLPDALDLHPVREGRFERDGVALLSAVSARGLRFDLVAIPGLVEQVFPKRGLPDPLLFDPERSHVQKESGKPLGGRSGARHAREERFLYLLASRSARKRLVLLAADRDIGSDRPRVLSPFLLDSLSSDGRTVSDEDLRLESTRSALGVRRVPVGKPVIAGPALDAGEVLRRAIHLHPSSSALLAAGDDALRRALDRRRARLSSRCTEWEGRLGRTTSLFDLGARPLSASRLERLATCAYRAFFADVLRLAVRDEAPGGIPSLDALSRGSLAHAALRTLARELIESGTTFRDLSEADAAARTSALAGDAARAWAEGFDGEIAPIFVRRTALEIAEWLRAVTSFERTREDALPTAGAEVRFGPPTAGPDERFDDPGLSTDACPSLAADGRSFRFQGQIDRLDRDGDRARVVDYKFGQPRPYGKTNKDNLQVAGGTRLQLPVYALAARDLGATAVESEYLFVWREKGMGEAEAVPVPFDEAGTGRSVESLGRFLELARRMTLAGTFLPRPYSRFDRKTDPCAWCDFATVCGPGHANLFLRKLASEPEDSLVLAVERLA